MIRMALGSNVPKSIFPPKGTTFFEEDKDAIDKMKRREEVAIAAHLVKEVELRAKEKAEAKAKEKEFRRLMQKELINSGLDGKQIAAIMKKEKVKQEKAKGKEANEEDEVVAQPTYTRMSL